VPEPLAPPAVAVATVLPVRRGDDGSDRSSDGLVPRWGRCLTTAWPGSHPRVQEAAMTTGTVLAFIFTGSVVQWPS
jgi:hypothetical protein